jgi:hypothetical protein
MLSFHVQRLSGGFVLTILTALCGLVAFAAQKQAVAGLVFAAYVVVISTYLTLLGEPANRIIQDRIPLTDAL